MARPHSRSTAMLFFVASITTFSDLNHKRSAGANVFTIVLCSVLLFRVRWLEKKSNPILCTWHLLRGRMPPQRIWHTTPRVPNAGSLRGHSVLTTNIWVRRRATTPFQRQGRVFTDRPLPVVETLSYQNTKRRQGLLTASPRVSTCVSIYRQCWFCIFSARCALAVSAEALPVFCPSFHFSALYGHFLSGALELMSALFSF